MNSEQVTALIRQFLPFISGIATALGLTWFDGVASAVLATVGPVMGLVSVIWSLVKNKQANILTAAKGLTDSSGAPIVEHIQLAPTPTGIQLQNETPAGISTIPPMTAGASMRR